MSQETFAHRLARLRREQPPAAGSAAAAPAAPASAESAAQSPAESAAEAPPETASDTAPGAPRPAPPAAGAPAGSAADPAAAAPAAALQRGLPDWARARLERALPLLHGARRCTGDPAGLDALGLGHARRRLRFSLDQPHGQHALREGLFVLPQELAALAKDPALCGLPLQAARFLDIETTGLSGGAGTYPFLVAIGRVEGADFLLDQHFLSHPAGEALLLAEVARDLAGGALLVSFFGKSFDRHRLEDKMRMHRVAPPFAGRPHLDLYHPLRRLYGKSQGDCRLSTLERALLGLERQDDLSGAHAPAAWFDHQAGRPHLLEGVFEHNRLDVLSLVGLCAHLGLHCRPVPAPEAPPGSALAARTRARAWAKLHRERREPERALAWLERALELAPAGTERREIEAERAECLWSLGRREAALESYRGLLGGGGRVQDECGLRAALRLLPDWTRSQPSAARQLLESALSFRARGLHPGRAARDAARWRRLEAALAEQGP